MALLAVQTAKIGGTTVTYAAAGGSGDTFKPNERAQLLVRNGGGSAITVTVAVPGTTKYGVNEPDVTSSSIAASGEAAIGPFPADLADPSDGLVHVTYSATASVTVRLAGV